MENSKTSNNEDLTIGLIDSVRWEDIPMAIRDTVAGPVTGDATPGSRTSSGAECLSGSTSVCCMDAFCAGYDTLMSDSSRLTVIPSLALDTFWGE